MPILNFRRRPQNELERGGRSRARADQTDPESSCPNCHRSWPVSSVWANFNTCPGCGWHYRTGARQRISFTVDEGSFEEMFSDIVSTDPLKFPGYAKKLSVVRAASNEKEAVVCGTASIGRQKCCLFVMEPQFMMGSMGAAVGEKITRLFEYATEQGLPVVGFTVSGGARMQEGLFSLMQMAKTSGAVLRHSEAGLLYMPVLTSPCLLYTSGKIAIVTGGSRGIGAAVGRELAAQGADVAVIYAGNQELADKICQECRDRYGAVSYTHLDVYKRQARSWRT